MSELTRTQWRTLLTRCPEQTYGDLISAVDDADIINPENPASVVDAAIANGPLVEDGAGMFPRIHLDDEPPESEDTGERDPEDTDSEGTNPGSEAGDSDEDECDSSTPANVASWSEVDFSIIDPRTWAPAQIEHESWMCRTDSKAPYAPWTDSDAPVECGRDHEDREGTVRCSTCDHAAGYKWGSDGSQEHVHADHDTAREWAEMDPSLSSDLAFIQHEDDPFAFVDGDDVRDPDTGEIHPAFRAILEHLGLTYADVSTSGSGVHAVYRGEIPLDGVPQAMFAIDDEPFGANEDVPEVEIYDSKHVCIATGDHVSGSGTSVNSWDEDTLTTILRANGIESSPEPSADTSIDLTEHTPTATTSDETTDEIRDIFAALDRINAQRVAHDTIVAAWNDNAGTSSGNRAFAPTWGPSANGTANIVDENIWQDTGGNGYGGVDVMAAIDCPDLPSYDENTQPRDLNGADWFRALEHLRDLGYPIPELEPDATDDDGDPEERRSDPTDLTATVSVKRAWDAAGRVSPSDLDDHELPVNDDAGSFACPCCGEPVDVVRAVAIDTGLVDSCEESLDETYPTAYDRARSLGAPLPEYYTTTDAIARFDALLDVIGEVTFWDLDTDAFDSEVTGTDDDVSGDAVRTLNPSWRESDSEASVPVFPSGTIWDADTERVLDAVRFVAVDSGLIEDPTAPVEGATFTEAYRRCRNHYAAPLPHWNPAGGDRTVTPDLPDGRDLVDTREVDGVNIDRLEDARERVESVFQDAATIDKDDSDPDPTPSVLTSLPATGKTTAAVKSARERPSAYLAPRKELQQQAVDKADRWGVDSYILPVFSEKSVRSEILEEAVAHVRANSKDCLRDRWALVNAAVGAVEGEVDASDIFEEEDDDSVDLDRATCPVADGDYGVAWALAVHVASRLKLHPGEIHMRAQGLFGTSLPCCEDGSCEYGKAWEDVRDPDNCPDLLVGSYTQAHVESARTYYERDSSGGTDRSPRVVVLDEFPGEAFTNDLGPEAFDFATWLARSLRGDIDDRRDMFDADLYSDDWVRAWLEGTIGEDSDPDSDNDDPILAEVERVIHALSRVGELLDARDSAMEILSEYRGAVDELGVAGILTEFVDGATPEDEVYRTLEDLTGESIDPDLQGISEWIHRDVHNPLARATDSGTESADAGIQTADTDLPIGGDLASLLEGAVDAAHTRGDAARERIRAAIESLRGGPDGCRQLAAWADDGYAHPDAHHILTGIITPTDDDSDSDSDVADTDADATRINTSSWAFDPSADDGTVMDVVSTAGNATTIVDRNDHGARLHTPPSRVAGNGEKAPLVGLDATGRAELWRVVLGEEVQTTDIFDSDRERRQFLEDALDLRVIQAADMPRYYEGDPATKDTDGDAALLQAIAEEYSGIQAPRQRGEEPERVGKPAAITTKDVMNVLNSDPRLDGVVDTWDNYGNVTGKNELGDHRLAAILGCQHFGDDAIEQFAALAGEEVDTDHLTGRGPDLDYDSDVANAYLKHMTEDKTMQAILRFARGEDGGATVVARTSALRDDLPVVGRGDVVETWSETATKIVRKARSLGREFTSADVRPAVDVKSRQVRRVLSELVDAGYLAREDGGPGRAHSYERIDDPGAGEVSIPDRDEAVPDTETPGRSSSNTYYTRNVRVFDPNRPRKDDSTPPQGTCTLAPPAPGAIEGVGPPG